MTFLKSTSRNKLLAGLIVSLACFAIVTYVNFWIFKHKDNGFLSKYGNYPDFYILHETPAIVGFKKTEKGHLQLIISPKISNSWTIKMPDGAKYESQDPNPIITLAQGTKNYELTPDNKENIPLVLNISYVSSETYRKKGNSTGDNYFISGSSYPVIAHKRYGIYDFAYREEQYEKDEMAEARKIIIEEIGVLKDDGTKEKILKISKYLYDNIEQHSGIPSDSMKYLSPLEQYRRIISGQACAWCHNYAVIYTFFMTAAGVPTRLVSIEGDVDQVKIGGHIFAESLIREKNKWAFNDVNSGFFMVEDPNGNPYDTIDLLNLMASNAIEKALFLRYDKTGIKKCIYETKTFKLFENIRTKPNVEIVYPLPRAKRYSLPSLLSRYTINPDIAYSPEGSNFKYYFKLTFLALGLVFLIFVIVTGSMLAATLLRKK
ncbi:MAG: hypothetical protein WAX69_07910 [Victivallales bacterium]